MNREHAAKCKEIHQCFYCKRVFNNHHALGVHLRTHQEEITARGWNYPAHSSNFVKVANTAPYSTLMSQPGSSSGDGGNNAGALLSRPTSSMDFSEFCLNESSYANGNRYFENNAGIPPSQFLMSPNLSTSTGHSTVHNSNPLTSSYFVPSASTATIGFQMGSSSYPGPYEICQFNTDERRTFRDGTRLFSRDTLPNSQHHNLGAGQCSGQNGAGENNKTSRVTSDRCKKRCLDEVMGYSDKMSSSKRPQMSSNLPTETEKPQKKELLLFKDVENSFSGLGFSSDNKEEDEGSLDLSLHL